MATNIDWAPFDKDTENECECMCGAVFRSHSKFVAADGIVSRKPCPACGTHSLRASRSGWETMTIKGTQCGKT